jgi:hypothetical protein
LGLSVAKVGGAEEDLESDWDVTGLVIYNVGLFKYVQHAVDKTVLPSRCTSFGPNDGTTGSAEFCFCRSRESADVGYLVVSPMFPDTSSDEGYSCIPFQTAVMY